MIPLILRPRKGKSQSMVLAVRMVIPLRDDGDWQGIQWGLLGNVLDLDAVYMGVFTLQKFTELCS